MAVARASAARPSRYAGVVANLTGNPAMSVPLWWNDDGLPIGVHFLGRFGDEATLIRLAAQLEAAQPWAGRLPAVHATTLRPPDRSSSGDGYVLLARISVPSTVAVGGTGVG